MLGSAFLAEAQEELLEATRAYELASAGLGADFLDDVERAVARAAAFPKHGSPYVAGTRRLVLRRFPFDVVYLEEAEQILVVAVAHQRRSPFYWRLRMAKIADL